jgi:uncharacterized protein
VKRSTILGALIAATMLTSTGLRAQLTDPQTPFASVPQIVTSGTGEARIAPDRATIFVGLQARAVTAAAAAAENARRQRMVLDTLRALGLTGEQLTTINYSVSPEMQYSPNGQTPPKVTGYVVTNTVRADVRRLDDVARVIDASLAKGANDVSNLVFFSSKADSVRRAAMTVAVANARANAEALARAAGGSVGALIEISTADQSGPPVLARMGMASTAQAKATPIEPGEQTFNAFVSVRWTFVPAK